MKRPPRQGDGIVRRWNVPWANPASYLRRRRQGDDTCLDQYSAVRHGFPFRTLLTRLWFERLAIVGWDGNPGMAMPGYAAVPLIQPTHCRAAYKSRRRPP